MKNGISGITTVGISTIKDQVYNVIKKDILDGIYKPGERILEDSIVKRLNVSKSPIREALKELSGEGLLEIIPNRGVFVRRLTKQDILNILDFRIIIEKYSIKKTIEIASNNCLNELEEIYKKMEEAYLENNVNKYALLDAQLHNTIYRLSGNNFVFKIASNVFYHLQPFRALSLYSKKRLDGSLIEHKNIISAILERNFSKAWKITKYHLKLASIEVIKHIDRLPND